MKSTEQKKAKELRNKGFSMREITRILGVSKSSVSLWVRNIELPPDLLAGLRDSQYSKEAVERRRTTRLKNENLRRQIIINQAKEQIKSISSNQLTLFGTALYWGEGGKQMKNGVRFSNSDPKMVRVIMKFFRKVCGVPESKFRGHIHIHPHLSVTDAELFWSEVSGIPLTQFYKTYNKMNKSSQGKKDTLPYGTLDLTVSDAKIFLAIKGWTEKVSELVAMM